MTTIEIHERLKARFGDDVGPLSEPKIDPFCVVKARADRRGLPLPQDGARARARLPRGPDRGRLAEAERHRGRLPPLLVHAPPRHRAQGRGRPRRARRSRRVEGVWKTANWFEREVYDLFGVDFPGHPDLRRIMLPDDWVGHPLRKDYQEAGGWHGISNVRENPLVELKRLDDARQAEKAAAARPRTPGPPRRPRRDDMEKLILRRVDRNNEEMILNFGPQHPSTHGVHQLHRRDRRRGDEAGHPGRRLPAPLASRRSARSSATPASCRTPTASTTSRRCSRTRGTPSRSRGCSSSRCPPRAQYLRAISCELCRIASHLVVGRHDGDGHRRVHADGPRPARARDHQRPHRGALRRAAHLQLPPHRRRRLRHAGGLARQGPRVPRPLRHVPRRVRPAHLLQRDLREAARERGGHPGRRRPSTTASSARTCAARGVDWDLRRDVPYGAYPSFKFDVPVGKGWAGTVGDCFDRYYVRCLEMAESSKIVRQALETMPEGEIIAKVPRNIKPEAGEALVARRVRPRRDGLLRGVRRHRARRTASAPAPAPSRRWASSRTSRPA